jgi:predicted ATP-grasp superfamily ATP-dependent carboligase
MVEVAAGTGAASVAAEVGLPAVIKPKRSWTSGSDRRHTSVVAATMPQLEAALDAVVGAGLPAVAQEWAPGRREAIWIFRAAGRTWARFAQVAYRTYPALGGQSVIRESIALPRDALEASEALVEAIDLEGFSEVEFRRDAAGRPLLMEINPRISASIELAARAGLDFPALIYAWAAGTPLEAVRDYRIGVRMRWLGGDLRWLLAALHGEPGPDVPSRALAVARFAAAFLQPHRYDYLSASDPLPALRATADFMRRGFRVRRPGARARPTPRAAT